MTRMTDLVAIAGALLFLGSCDDSSRMAGNSANTGNAQATGRIFTPSGAPASGVWVECIPDSLFPWDERLPGWTSITDGAGSYVCTDLPWGRVGVAAHDPGTGLSRWRDDTLAPGRSSGKDAMDTLAAPGAVRVALPPGTSGTLYLSGLDIAVAVSGRQEITITDVPAGWAGEVRLARSVSTSSIVDSGLRVLPGRTDSAGYTRHSATLRVALAGKLDASVADLPLLVRIDSSWQGFAASLPDGSDLRLATTAGEALPLTVASWDRDTRVGVLWTLLDSLAAPGDSIDLVLSWGLPVPASAPAAAFSSSRGWIAAWPLGDAGATVFERLGAFPGTATSLSTAPGVASTASRFDGRVSKIVIPDSKTGALDLPEGGPYTMSCWARLDRFGTSRFVMGRGELGSGIKFQSTFDGDTNNWLAKDFRSSPAGGYYVMSRADTAVWTHLAMTVSGTRVRLFVNGSRQVVDSGFDSDPVGRRAALFAIGAATDTLDGTSQHFSGDLSEAWVQGVARSADWIRLVAANQKPGGRAAKPVP